MLHIGTAAAGLSPRSVLIVVPYAAGAAPDLVARILAEKLAIALGQPVRVENRPGASGSIGGASVARSAPDGETLLVADSALLTVNSLIYRSSSFDAARDLAPVAGLVESSVFLLVAADLPVNSVQEFVEYARRTRPPLAYATTGIGSAFHLTFEHFKSRAGIDLLHVPYKTLSQAAAAAAVGEVAVLLAGKSAEPFVQSGKLRVLATTAAMRSEGQPDVPALNEQYPGVELSIWQGLFAPTATPAPVLERLEGEVKRILEMPDVLQRLANANDLRPLASATRVQLTERIRQERERNGALVKQLGLTTQ